jgi:glycosyltransferase involved in cell wall biosynthesis
MGHHLVCLLPVRNGEADLPDYFASVSRFADAVVALDDGSTDGTAALLKSHPLVKVLLLNPQRPSYHGWDDSANRRRLLEAAGSLEPRWVFSLDADERLSEDDAASLTSFLRSEALPHVAYGFRVHRMIGDVHSYDRCALWVYRLFRYRFGQRFPSARLHFMPVPTDVPRRQWVQTRLRIQHVASLTEARRQARYAKYQQADPHRAYQASYENLLAPPEGVRPWTAVSPARSVPLDTARYAALSQLLPAGEPEPLDPTRPVLSAVVISRGDEQRIDEVMQALVGQQTSEPVEFILVCSGGDRTAEIVRARYPQVRVVEFAEGVLPGRARNAGLRLARGDFVSFPGSHVILPPGSLEARILAHYLGHTMVTGTALNGTPQLSGWASWFLDQSEALPGRPSGELSAAPSHCSYLRWPLLELGGFPEDRRTGEDTVVNWELWRRRHTAYRAADVVLVHRSPCTDPFRLIRHHFQRGLGFGRILRETKRRRPLSYLLLVYPFRRVVFISRNVFRWGAPRRTRFAAVFPLVLLAIAAALAGALSYLLTHPAPPGGPAPGKARP